jgi:hypothetical protein
MAVQILSRRNVGGHHARHQADPVQADMDWESLQKPGDYLDNLPVDITAQELVGEMPESKDILKEGVLNKLTPSYEWKPMRAALTKHALCFARENEQILRDKIPLQEILDFRKRHDVPRQTDDDSKIAPKVAKLSSLFDNAEGSGDIHMIQIRTKEGGYNSGRTYYFNCEDEETCNAWIRILRPACDDALVRQRAGPGFLLKLQLRSRRLSQSIAVQGLVAFLIFMSFLSNIIQTELEFPDGSESADRAQVAYDRLEFFFTVVFAAELALNLVANFFWPFVTDPWYLHPHELSISVNPYYIPIRFHRTLHALRRACVHTAGW